MIDRAGRNARRLELSLTSMNVVVDALKLSPHDSRAEANGGSSAHQVLHRRLSPYPQHCATIL
jgi:hypothetical protein